MQSALRELMHKRGEEAGEAHILCEARQTIRREVAPSAHAQHTQSKHELVTADYFLSSITF